MLRYDEFNMNNVLVPSASKVSYVSLNWVTHMTLCLLKEYIWVRVVTDVKIQSIFYIWCAGISASTSVIAKIWRIFQTNSFLMIYRFPVVEKKKNLIIQTPYMTNHMVCVNILEAEQKSNECNLNSKKVKLFWYCYRSKNFNLVIINRQFVYKECTFFLTKHSTKIWLIWCTPGFPEGTKIFLKTRQKIQDRTMEQDKGKWMSYIKPCTIVLLYSPIALLQAACAPYPCLLVPQVWLGLHHAYSSYAAFVWWPIKWQTEHIEKYYYITVVSS